MITRPQEKDGSAVHVAQLPPSYESLGAILDFLAVDKVFGLIPAYKLVPAITQQLRRQWHVCAFRGKLLVGYCGWVLFPHEIGEQWLRGELEAEEFTVTEDADAGALTIVRVVEPELVLRLIRECRRLNPGRHVFFRREYEGAKKPRRETGVRNVTGLDAAGPPKRTHPAVRPNDEKPKQAESYSTPESVPSQIGTSPPIVKEQENEMTTILIDAVKAISVQNGIVRIECVSAGPNNEERAAGTLLIPGNRAAPVLQTIVQAMQEIEKKMREQAQQPQPQANWRASARRNISGQTKAKPHSWAIVPPG